MVLHYEMPGFKYVCERESVFVCSSVHACAYVCVCMIFDCVCIYRIMLILRPVFVQVRACVCVCLCVCVSLSLSFSLSLSARACVCTLGARQWRGFSPTAAARHQGRSRSGRGKFLG